MEQDVNAKSGEQTVVIDTPSADQTAMENIRKAFKLKDKEPVKESAPEKVAETPAEETGATTQPAETPHEAQETTGEIQDDSTLDQATRTWLGRKVAEQTDKKVTPLLEKIAQLEEIIAARQQPPQDQQPQQPQFDPDEPVYTKGEVLNLFKQAQTMEMSAKQRFVKEYVTSVETQLKEDNVSPDVREAVWKTLDEMKNPISHRDPRVAASLNYAKALRMTTLSQQKEPEKKIPVSGEPPITATGLSVGTQQETARPSTFVLDDKTQKMMKSFNLGNDWVQKKLQEKR